MTINDPKAKHPDSAIYGDQSQSDKKEPTKISAPLPGQAVEVFRLEHGGALPGELQPCPFCGEDDASYGKEPKGHFIRCLNCYSRSPITALQEGARTVWNSRSAAVSAEQGSHPYCGRCKRMAPSVGGCAMPDCPVSSELNTAAPQMPESASLGPANQGATPGDGSNSAAPAVPEGLRPCGCLLDEANMVVGSCAVHTAPSSTLTPTEAAQLRNVAASLESEADRLERENVYSAQGISRDWLRLLATQILTIARIAELAPPSHERSSDDELRRALRFYARGYHAILDPAWEAEEGWLCPPNDESWMVEDGGIARAVLTGKRVEWEGEDENTPIDGELPPIAASAKLTNEEKR